MHLPYPDASINQAVQRIREAHAKGVLTNPDTYRSIVEQIGTQIVPQRFRRLASAHHHTAYWREIAAIDAYSWLLVRLQPDRRGLLAAGWLAEIAATDAHQESCARLNRTINHQIIDILRTDRPAARHYPRQKALLALRKHDLTDPALGTCRKLSHDEIDRTIANVPRGLPAQRRADQAIASLAEKGRFDKGAAITALIKVLGEDAAGIEAAHVDGAPQRPISVRVAAAAVLDAMEADGVLRSRSLLGCARPRDRKQGGAPLAWSRVRLAFSGAAFDGCPILAVQRVLVAILREGTVDCAVFITEAARHLDRLPRLPKGRPSDPPPPTTLQPQRTTYQPDTP